MPVLIKTSEIQYKDNLGNYHGVNAIAEKKIADQIADLDEAITAQEDRIDDDIEQMTTDVNDFIDDKTAEITEVLDDYESMADGIVSSAQTAISGIDNQRATMIAAIASVAGQGTDATLTQQGVAADAKAAGDLIAIQSATPSANSTKLWINENAVDEYTVPTFAEHRSMNMSMLQDDVNSILMASNPYANAFSTSNTYEVGDYVLVNGSHYNPPMPGSSTDPGEAMFSSSVVYRCHTSVTTPGAWTGDANWTAVKVMNETKALKSAINSIHQIPAGGTSGQILTKASGTNYDVQWSPVGMPSDTQVDDAVSDWLDDHPEATTTVEDGSITKVKLHSNLSGEIDDKAASIKVEDDAAYYHDLETEILSAKYHSNGHTNDQPARYAYSKNLFDGALVYGNIAGVKRTLNGRFVDLDAGTFTNTSWYMVLNTNSDILSRFAGKTLNIYVYWHKQSAWPSNGSYWTLEVNGSSKLIKSYTYPNGWVEFSNITFPEELTQLGFYFNSIKNTEFSQGDFYWLGAYESALVNTETTVTDGLEVTLPSGHQFVDTAMHTSNAKYISDTKEYIDNHIPDIKTYWTEEIYALPEKFGAVGDGVADDSTAIADCISYAKTYNKAIKGYGKYKVSSTIVLDGRNLDVYLREIDYTGNQHAVEIKTDYVRFDFHKITSASKGIQFGKTSDANPLYARFCRVTGNEVTSTGDCLTLLQKTLYNTVEIRVLSSSTGNCITADESEQNAFNAAEYVFRDSSCACPNGYVAYEVKVCKFYNFTIEKNCKYGFYNPLCCTIMSCRTLEQFGCYASRLIYDDTGYNNGPLITFTRQPNGSGLYSTKLISEYYIPWFAIDVSALNDFDLIPAGAGAADIWNSMSYNGVDLGTPIGGWHGTDHQLIGEKMYFIGGHKVFVPSSRRTLTITAAEYDFRLFESQNEADILAAMSMEWGTDFIIGVSHTDIYFNASFGAIGYNDLTLTQANGNTATIYDKLGNVLFDGTSEGDGKWRLRCMMDRSSNGRCQNLVTRWHYDGTNEVWEITQIS